MPFPVDRMNVGLLAVTTLEYPGIVMHPNMGLQIVALLERFLTHRTLENGYIGVQENMAAQASH
jgi:hypothetical protein